MQFAVNFGDYPTAPGLPADWTSRWNNQNMAFGIQASGIAGGISGKVLKIDNTSANTGTRCAISYDPVGIIADAEVLSRFYLAGTDKKDSEWGGVGLRIQGAGGGEEVGYWTHLRTASFSNTSRIHYQTNHYLDGPRSTWLPDPLTWLKNNWYYIRHRMIGNEHKTKVWLASNPEPDWIQQDVSDAILTPGYVGFINWKAEMNFFADWFAVGTEGDPAPLP